MLLSWLRQVPNAAGMRLECVACMRSAPKAGTVRNIRGLSKTSHVRAPALVMTWSWVAGAHLDLRAGCITIKYEYHGDLLCTWSPRMFPVRATRVMLASHGHAVSVICAPPVACKCRPHCTVTAWQLRAANMCDACLLHSFAIHTGRPHSLISVNVSATFRSSFVRYLRGP